MEFIGGGYSEQFDSPDMIEYNNGECETLLYLFKSNAIVEMDEKQQQVDYGEMLVVPKGKPHKILHIMDYYIIDWLHFTLTKENINFIKMLDFPVGSVLEIENPAFISNIVSNCCYVASKNCEHLEVACVHFLAGLFCSMDSLMNNRNERSILKSKYPEIVNMHKAIYKNPEADWSLKKMCEFTNYSISTIQKVYKQIYRTSCKEAVLESRIIYARYIIGTTALDIKEVSNICGFNSYEHFARTFKKMVGCTPVEYRKKKVKD